MLQIILYSYNTYVYNVHTFEMLIIHCAYTFEMLIYNKKRKTYISSRPKVFLKISENSQENTSARVSDLIKLPEACNSGTK